MKYLLLLFFLKNSSSLNKETKQNQKERERDNSCAQWKVIKEFFFVIKPYLKRPNDEIEDMMIYDIC